MWQTKYALAVPKKLGVGVDFWLCSEDNFLTGASVVPVSDDSVEISWPLSIFKKKTQIHYLASST